MEETLAPKPPPPRPLGALRIAVVRGVPIRLHFSVLVALPCFAWMAEARMRAPVMLAAIHGGTGPLVSSWTWALLLTLALALSVLVHEGAHALVARFAGGGVGEVNLFLLGGCMHASPLPSAGARAAVAAAGPMLSLVAGLALTQGGGHLSMAHIDVRYALLFLGQVQLVLGAIHLIPTPPLDGGRLLVALLEPWVGRPRALRDAAFFGQLLAVMFALVGALAPNLLLIALAGVLWAGSEEGRAAAAEEERRAYAERQEQRAGAAIQEQSAAAPCKVPAE